jgi:recombination protein U
MGYWNSRGLRGSQLEENLNITNKIYLEQGLAVVQKIPTSIKPVELDPAKGTIKLAYFEEKSTVDYLGNIQGNDCRLPISTNTRWNLWKLLKNRRGCPS